MRAVVESTEAKSLRNACLLGDGDGTEADACPIHSQWELVRGRIDAFLEQTTNADILSGRASVPA